MRAAYLQAITQEEAEHPQWADLFAACRGISSVDHFPDFENTFIDICRPFVGVASGSPAEAFGASQGFTILSPDGDAISGGTHLPSQPATTPHQAIMLMPVNLLKSAKPMVLWLQTNGYANLTYELNAQNGDEDDAP